MDSMLKTGELSLHLLKHWEIWPFVLQSKYLDIFLELLKV